MPAEDPVSAQGRSGKRAGPPPVEPPAPPAVSLASVEGLADLEREIVELLEAPVEVETEPAPEPGPVADQASPVGPEATASELPSESASAAELELREEVIRLRGALETLRKEILEHRSHIAGFHGQFKQLHSSLSEIKGSPSMPPGALPPPSPPSPRGRPPVAASTSPPRPMSAAPVFFLDEQGKRVEAQAFFTLGKGGALERFLTGVLASWETSGFPLRTKGGTEGFSLTLEGDPEGRGLRVLPSGMYLMRLGHREMEEIEHLPPLVSSKVWPQAGGFTRKP